jgi:hypothetical protein
VDERYTAEIEQASQLFVEALLAKEEGLQEQSLDTDGLVMVLLRQVGLRVMSGVLKRLGEQVTRKAADGGLVVQRRDAIEVASIFGPVRVESPYLWADGRSARPVKDELALTHRKRSKAVERALTDFGAEESFGHAVERFEEHYGWSVGRTTALRVVEARASEAERYVAQRLDQARLAFDEPVGMRPGLDRLLVELDGSEIRTGTLVPAADGGKSPVRQLDRRERVEAWRDVRVGLARGIEEVQRTYVARMDSYPNVVGQLFSAAVDRGLSSRTKVVAVGDGGNGLREELTAQLPNLRFILDPAHLKQHLYETAEAIGHKDTDKHRWVSDKVERMQKGQARQVIDELAEHRGRGKKRVLRLVAHLRRFQDAVAYDSYRAQGLPTGSGEVESAHRYIPQKRLKLPGASWHPKTINPMLALRVLRANGWWSDFWRERQVAAA